MRKRLLWIAPLAMLGFAAFVALGGALVMALWNWLLPALFRFPPVTFWQALALLALCRTLFGGWGGGGPVRSRMRRRMAERWEKMTPEEREKLRRGFRGHWGDFEPPAATPGA